MKTTTWDDGRLQPHARRRTVRAHKETMREGREPGREFGMGWNVNDNY
jgi:hypothetical protein